MKQQLTEQDLKEINKLPSLVGFCKTIIDVVNYGTDKEYCFDVMESLIPLFKKRCRVFKLYKPVKES